MNEKHPQPIPPEPPPPAPPSDDDTCPGTHHGNDVVRRPPRKPYPTPSTPPLASW